MSVQLIISIIGLCMAIIVPVFTTWVNIKIKFAKDAKEVNKYIKTLGLNIILIFLNIFLLFRLIIEVTSQLPLNRFSIFNMIISTFSLFFNIIAICVYFIINNIYKKSNENKKTIFNSLTNILDKYYLNQTEHLSLSKKQLELFNQHLKEHKEDKNKII